jgi:hypothetical protein
MGSAQGCTSTARTQECRRLHWWRHTASSTDLGHEPAPQPAAVLHVALEGIQAV